MSFPFYVITYFVIFLSVHTHMNCKILKFLPQNPRNDKIVKRPPISHLKLTHLGWSSGVGFRPWSVLSQGPGSIRRCQFRWANLAS